jgi:hypothetical protein
MIEIASVSLLKNIVLLSNTVRSAEYTHPTNQPLDESPACGMIQSTNHSTNQSLQPVMIK